MYHTVDVAAMFVEDTLDDRCIGTCGGENQATGIQRDTFNTVCQVFLTTIYKVFGHFVVVTLGIFFCQVFGKDIMAC